MRYQQTDDLVGILIREDTEYQMHRSPLVEDSGERSGGIAVVSAVKPGLDVARERAARKLLEAGWPAGFAQSLLKRRAGNLEMLLRAKHLPRKIGVADLVVTGKL